MKKNKIASLMLTGVLVASMAVPAFAANITIEGTGSQFQAYKLLDLTTSVKATHTDHDGEHTGDCYNYSYTLNEKYATAVKAVTELEDEDAIVSKLESMTADETRQFANAMYAQVRGMEADKTADGQVISGADQGYYLIVESVKGADPDTHSLVMLDTAGQDNIKVETKEGVPTLTKKIVEGDKKMDANDYAVGDKVDFELTGTMPDNIDGYTKYKYIMHDSLSAGLKLDESSVKVTVDGAEAAGFVLKTSDLDEGCSFEIAFDDIKVGNTVTKDTKVVVTYKAEVLASADRGNPGNPNEAHLEFSSNPNAGGEGDTAHSPKDKVTAFTFDVIVNKVDKAGAALAGANFKLMKLEGEVYVDYKDNVMTDGQTSFTFSGLDSGKYKLVETVVPDGYNKADDVEFQIVSEMDGDDEDSADPSLTGLKVMQGDKLLSDGTEDAVFTIDLGEGSATTKVVNTTGIRLPSTGGMGTYVIYGGGAALIAGGIVLAVVKKKNSGAAE